jgi:Protein of unknown function (DUF2510)
MKAQVALEAISADLRPDEAVLADIWANHEVSKTQTTLGAIVVTTRRIRYVGSLATLLVDRSFPLESVTGIEVVRRTWLARLEIRSVDSVTAFGVRTGKRLDRWLARATWVREQLAHQLASASVPTNGARPGWYDDPHGVASQRWWNGTAWTEHAR